MLEPVVSIETAPTIPPSKRAQRLDEELRDAEDAVNEALAEAGLIPNAFISPGAHTSCMVGMHGLRVKEWNARWHLSAFLERRIKRLESALRNVLACDGLDDEARLLASDALHGRGLPHRRLPSVWSEAEQALVERYRSLEDPDRAMLRTLLVRLDEAAAARKGAR